MASSACHSSATRSRKGSSSSSTMLPADPEKSFAQSVERLQQRMDACSRMRSFSEMKSTLEEIIELVKYFFSDTNELAQLYMDGSVFHSFVLSAVQCLIKRSHKRDNQMFMKALDLLFTALDKYERSSFYHQERQSNAKDMIRMKEEFDESEYTLAFRDISDEIREIDDRAYPFFREADSDSDLEDGDERDEADLSAGADDQQMDIDDRYNNEPGVQKDFFETFLVAILPEIKEHLMSTFQVKELLAKSATAMRTRITNHEEVSNFLNTSIADSDEELMAEEKNDGIGLIPASFKMPLRDDLTIRYMSHVFKLVFFYFRNVNADTLLQSKFAKVALLIVTNQRFFQRTFAFKIVRMFLTNGRKDGVDFDLPNSLVGYLLKNFLNDELEELTARLKVNQSVKQFMSCLNKSFIRELVGILNFIEFLDRPLWAFRIVANVKQSLDRLYDSLKQAIQLLISAKDSMSKGNAKSFNANCSSEYIDILLVQCITGAAMILNKLKDFYASYEEAFVVANILFGLLTPARAHFFTRNQVEFKKVFYRLICILICERGIAINVFLFEYWPRLKPIWEQDIMSASQPDNGSLSMISRFCKYAVDLDESDGLAEIAERFVQAFEVHAARKANVGVKIVTEETLHAIFDLMTAYEKIVDDQKNHSEHCMHGKKTKTIEKLGQVSRRLLADVLVILEQMQPAVFFKTSVYFYRRIFENTQLLALFDTDVWVPHIELILKRADHIYNEHTIEQIRETFRDAGGFQLLTILSGILDNFVVNNKCTTVGMAVMNNCMSVIKIAAYQEPQNKKILKRIARLEAHFNIAS